MDSKLASLAVAAAALPPSALQEAIQTAYDFHPSGGSALYAFASNHGKIKDADQLQQLEQEVQQAILYLQANADKINSGEWNEYAGDKGKAEAAKVSLVDYEIKLLNNLLYAASIQAGGGEQPPVAAPTASAKEAKVLISEDVFRRAIDECAALLNQVAGSGNEVEGKLTKIQHELQQIEQSAGGDLAFVLDDETHPQAAQWAQNLIKALGAIKQEVAGRVVSPAAAPAPNVQGLVAAVAIKEAGFGEDTLRAMVNFARTNKAQLQQVMKAKGPQAVAEALKQIPGAENSAPRVAPAFIQWLSGAMNDSSFVGMLEHVFTKSASVDEAARQLTTGALTLAGLKATHVAAQGSDVSIYGLKINASVISTTAKLASSYGIKVKLAGEYLPPAEQPETYPEPPRQEPPGIQHTAAAPIPPKPSAAGNHAGAGNPVNPTGDAPTVSTLPTPTQQTPAPQEEEPAQAPIHTGYGETGAGGAYGEKRTGGAKTAIGPWGGEGYHVRQSLSAPGSYAHTMNGEGKVKVNVRKRGESILGGQSQQFPDRKAALAFVEQAKQNPEAEIISVSILWGGQWSLTNEWERDPEPMEDGTPAVEWYERVTNPIYRTASYTEDDLDAPDAPECPACGGQGGYGEKRTGASKAAIGPWGGEGYHVRQSLSAPGSYAHTMNGEGEVRVVAGPEGTTLLNAQAQSFPDRKQALAAVEQAKQDPSNTVIRIYILWGGQWSLTNEWTRDPEPMEDGSPAVEWYERATNSIYRTAAYTDDDLDQPDAPECPACGGPGGYLGALGPRAHFRCQNCGMQFSHIQASKVAADGTLVGTLAEIESMLSHVQELADKAVAQARLQNNPTLVANAERTNVKVYEALMAVRSTKADAPATTVTAADVKNPGAELSYDEKEQLLQDYKGEAPKPVEDKDPRYGYKLPLTSALVIAAPNLPALFDGETAKQWLEAIKTQVQAPIVAGYVSTLGGAARASIMLTIGLDPKGTWESGIFENSTHAKVMLDYTGELEVIAYTVRTANGGFGKLKFRKIRVKSMDQAVAKLQALVQGLEAAKSGPEKFPTLAPKATTAAAQLSHGPDASQGDNVDNAIEYIKANGSSMDDYSVQQLREAMTAAGYTQQVADDAITELLGQEALQALATPVKVLLT